MPINIGGLSVYLCPATKLMYVNVLLSDSDLSYNGFVFVPGVDIGFATRTRHGFIVTVGNDIGYCINTKDIIGSEFSIGMKGRNFFWRSTINFGWGW
jgi:hypothetical protein